ncbi:NAD(+) diphosphatase [Clostridium thermarum]|uniref:NAD(+) diphosphatase n=1 Tax=Clostridium thermarum TaxID=1716543 RepID=UPI0013D4A884|nr:NAD(+) diphosphatase [Clostridium thermarum]
MENEEYIYFIPAVEFPEEESTEALWFVFNGNKLAVETRNDKAEIPSNAKVNEYRDKLKSVFYLGELRGIQCYTAEMDNATAVGEDFKFIDLKTIMPSLEPEIFFVSARAIQIINWDKEHKYCGCCGGLMKLKRGERAKVCPECGLINYPRISPAIIVAVIRGKEILLAHNKNFKPGMYSVIAGFVDAGETFEECVKREVMEEVGIRVKNIKYFRSQTWPFPNSLMVGFTAEYDSGEISPDGVEIEEANWYTADNLPSIPSKVTIAGKLIKWFVESTNNKDVI